MWGAETQIVAGITKTMFYPTANCTRAQIVSFLWRAEGKPMPANSETSFEDIKEDKWYYNAVLWATENNIVSGYTKDSFAPEATCTRAEMATFIWRMEGKIAPNGIINPFMDISDGRWYTDAAKWTYENGIVSGYDVDGGKAFAPNNAITRAETVTMLYRFYR